MDYACLAHLVHQDAETHIFLSCAPDFSSLKTVGKILRKLHFHVFDKTGNRWVFFTLVPLFLCVTSLETITDGTTWWLEDRVSFQISRHPCWKWDWTMSDPECVTCLMILAWLRPFCRLQSIFNFGQNKATTLDSLSGFAVVLALISIVCSQRGITPAVSTPKATVGSHDTD